MTDQSTTKKTRLVFRAAGKCADIDSDCSCLWFDHMYIYDDERGANIPPLHDGCTCFAVEPKAK